MFHWWFGARLHFVFGFNFKYPWWPGRPSMHNVNDIPFKPFSLLQRSSKCLPTLYRPRFFTEHVNTASLPAGNVTLDIRPSTSGSSSIPCEFKSESKRIGGFYCSSFFTKGSNKFLWSRNGQKMRIIFLCSLFEHLRWSRWQVRRVGRQGKDKGSTRRDRIGNTHVLFTSWAGNKLSETSPKI